MFHRSLNPSRVLFIGLFESLGEYGRYFSAIKTKWKIFLRKGELPDDLADLANLALFPMEQAAFVRTGVKAEPQPEQNGVVRRTERMLLEEYVPPAVLVNDQSETLHFYGCLERILSFSGEATRDILQLAREDVHGSRQLRCASRSLYPP